MDNEYRTFETLVAFEVDQKINEIDNKYINNISNIKSDFMNYKDYQENLKLIPKYMTYMEYMIELLRQLPRVEKFNIGNEYKQVMYQTFENIMYLEKVENKSKMYYLNKIDAEINIQRVYLRIMAKNKWISIEKFNSIMLEKISEIGKIIGGLIKYYAKDNKKSV